MCKQSGTPLRKVLHLTAGAPGITNAANGVVLSAPNLDNWNEVPLQALLECATGIPCLVENDTNLAALGESWRGAAQGIPTFVFIALGTGIGAGLFLNGHLHRGAQGSAGEIGYFGVGGSTRTTMRMTDPGQLEQVIGGAGIEAEWRCRLQNSGLAEESTLTVLRASHIFDRAANGDELAAEIVHWTAAILAEAIADIALLLNPDVVVLGGGIGSHPELCRATEKLLARHEIAHPRLHSSSLGTQAQLHGALSVSLAAVREKILE
jgi:glucokinase